MPKILAEFAFFHHLLQFAIGCHDDPDIRNVTYRQSDGRFCIIDFEFATLLGDVPEARSLKPAAAQ